MSLKPEQVDHINTVNWFKESFPEYAEDFHHFANERKCSQIEGRTLKRMGVAKGVSDFFLAIPCGGYHGLWIELKVGKGRLSKEQDAFLERKYIRGYMSMAVWGHDAAKALILSYLGNSSTKCLNNRPKNCE